MNVSENKRIKDDIFHSDSGKSKLQKEKSKQVITDTSENTTSSSSTNKAGLFVLSIILFFAGMFLIEGNGTTQSYIGMFTMFAGIGMFFYSILK